MSRIWLQKFKITVKNNGLTHAYLLALALIAGSMLSAYLIVNHTIKTSVDKASVINMAGMQRMLSQRLGLLSDELITAENRDTKNKLVNDYASALQKFSDNHSVLYKLSQLEDTNDAIRNLYSGQAGVDARSRRFIALAEDVLDEARTSTQVSTRQQSQTSQLVAIARNGFVSELDAVVQEYERQSTQAIDDFERLELIILIVGLLILLFEALFIFRPIVKISALRQKQLETSNNELMEFSFRISHDLRAPVASSRGMLEIAQDAIEDDDKELATDVVGRIDVLLNRLEILIEDIISVTRNSVTETEPENVNLRAIITNTLEGLSAMSGYEKCHFDIDIDDKTEIVTKKLYLQQIVQNLLSNAIKYSNCESDLDDSRISISCKKIGKLYELCVDDNGIGIPESSRNNMFNMFMRFHPGVSNGSGLGLYLSQKNAIALGGNLRYEPREKGSRFALKFQPQKA